MLRAPDEEAMLKIPGTSLPPPAMQARIMVVDPHRERGGATANILRSDGHKVFVSSELRNLGEILKHSPADVLVLSCEGIDGLLLDTLRALRESDELRALSILLLGTSAASEEDVASGLGAGADDFIVLPDRPEELKARARVQLRHKRDRALLTWVHEQRSRFRSAALLDSLTGVLNRRGADEALARLLGAGANESFLVILADLDHFKSVNDTFGHQVGDVVLKEVASTLSRLTRSGDFVARFGGEEFIIIVHKADLGLAPLIAERFRKGVEALRLSALPAPRRITVSLGVSGWEGRGAPPSIDALIEAADNALYRAKAEGRNRVEVEWLLSHRSDPAPAEAEGSLAPPSIPASA